MKGFRKLGEPLFSKGLTQRLALGTRSVAGGVSTYSISGTVYDADGSTAVSGATVTLGAYSAVSAANGTYTISDIPPATSGSMTCTKAGYSWTAITVAAMTGNLTGQNYTNAWWAGGGSAAGCLVAYQPEGAASQAASYINLANPGTNNANPIDAPTWSSANGWVLVQGNTNYLDTGITPAANMSAIVKFSNVTTEDSYLFGANGDAGSTKFNITPNISGSNLLRYANGAEASVAPEIAEGVLAIAGTDGYRNGTDEANIGAWSGVSTYTVHIGRLNRASPVGYISAYIKAIAIYSVVLTSTQVQIITDAIESPFEPTPAGAGEFMMVFMTDTHYQDAAAATVHEQMTQYIADNAATLGVEIVLHGGDVIYPPLDQVAQFLDADTMFDNLDAANIPYLVTIGNHDYDGDDGTDTIGRGSTRFNTPFPQSRYTGKSWWNGGFYDGSGSENAYLLMTINSVDWIFITMEFGPRAAVLAWCDALLTTYSARHAIIVTHSYIHRDGTTVDSTDTYAPNPNYTLDGDRKNGDEIWTALKDHDNIRLMLSGHDKGSIGWASAKLQTNSDPGGIPVNQSVANFQSYKTFASGVMQFFRINPTAKTIKCETFSPYMNMFFHDAANEYTVDWEP